MMTQDIQTVTNISLDIPIADSSLQDDSSLCDEALKRMIMVSVDDFTAVDTKADWKEVGVCMRGSASACSCKHLLSHFTTYTVMDGAPVEPEETAAPPAPPPQTNSSQLLPDPERTDSSSSRDNLITAVVIGSVVGVLMVLYYVLLDKKHQPVWVYSVLHPYPIFIEPVDSSKPSDKTEGAKADETELKSSNFIFVVQ